MLDCEGVLGTGNGENVKPWPDLDEDENCAVVTECHQLNQEQYANARQ